MTLGLDYPDAISRWRRGDVPVYNDNLLELGNFASNESWLYRRSRERVFITIASMKQSGDLVIGKHAVVGTY